MTSCKSVVQYHNLNTGIDRTDTKTLTLLQGSFMLPHFPPTPTTFLWMCLVAQSCPTPCALVGCMPPGSSVHGILQARVLEWVAILVTRRSSQPRDWTRFSCITGGFLTIWATRVSTFFFNWSEVKSLTRVWLSATPWTVACTRLLRPWDFLDKSAGVGCHFLPS